ncbi:MAG: type IV pilus assembly protein PilM [Elainellaceae cyanobacterium]
MFDALGKLPFMKSKSVGIEIAPDRVNVAQLHRKGQAFQLTELATAEIPEEIFQEGQILDASAMAEIIQSILTEKKIKCKVAATAISGGGNIVTRIISVPAELDDRELREMVLNQEAGLYLPFPREEADINYQKLDLFVDEDGIEKVQVLLAAARKEATDSYLETFQQAGLSISTIEVSEFSLIRTIREQLRQLTPRKAAALVDIGFESTEISVVIDGIPHFSRSIPIGTFQIQSAVNRAMNLPLSRNTDLLQGMTVPTIPRDAVGSPQSTAGDAFDPGAAVMLRSLEQLSDELSRSINFYLNQGEDRAVDQLFLAGPGATIGQLDKFFTQRLGLLCSRVNPIETLGLEVSDEIPLTRPSNWGIVLGLAYKPLRRPDLNINFLENQSEHRLARTRHTQGRKRLSTPLSKDVASLADLDPWTQSLIGVIQLDTEEPMESYVDHLEEKYR